MTSKIKTYILRRWFEIGKIVLLLLAITSLSVPNFAWALVLGANNGQIDFSVKPVGAANPGAPIFGASNELTSPGRGYATLGPPLLPVQTVGPAGIALPGLAGVANPALIDGGFFGAGQTALSAFGFPGGGAISWTSGFVADFAVDNFASVNDSQGTATFTNNGPGAFIGWGGAFLSVKGSIGAPGAFVAASIAGTIGGVPFDPIVIASDGAGPLVDGVWTMPGGALTAAGFILPGQNAFTAWGVDIIPGLFNIAAGGNITLQGTLSLIADPGASIELGILPAGAPRPDFGAGAQVPEPATILLLSSGLVGLAGFRKKFTKS